MAWLLIFNLSAISVFAKSDEDYLIEAESRKALTVDSNLIENWPAGPELGCESAILIDANTGVILYSKNIHEKLFPASITKLLTAVVAYDNCSLGENVTFSYDAVNSIDWRVDANMGIHGMDVISLEEALYGMLVGSANEAAYAIAEHVSGEGNLDKFAELMNEKAASLGCVDSHFVTPNGIHDENHYTSAYDMSLIAREFFSIDILSRIAGTAKHQIPQSSTQPNDNMIVYAKSKLHEGKEYAYEGLIGTKTGYTDYARQTLVSCAEKNGLKLICVVMKEEGPYQYTDTIELFNYGFNNFEPVTIASKDTRFNMSSISFFSTDSDLFGSSKPILELNSDNYILLPVGTSIDNTVTDVSYTDLDSDELARINYYYSDTYVGYASIIPSGLKQNNFNFSYLVEDLDEPEEDDTVYINIINLVIIIAICTAALASIIGIIAFIRHKLKKKRHTVKNYTIKKIR